MERACGEVEEVKAERIEVGDIKIIVETGGPGSGKSSSLVINLLTTTFLT